MKMILAACAATMIATGAFAAEPTSNPPAPASDASGPVTMPVSAAPGETCAAMITRARGMTLPSDPAKAQSIRDEIAAADAAGDDAACRAHMQTALNELGGS